MPPASDTTVKVGENKHPLRQNCACLHYNCACAKIRAECKIGDNKPSTSKLVRSLDEKLTVCLSPSLHSALLFAHAQFYLRGCLLKQNITMKRHMAYSNINTKFRTHLKRVHSGHYSGTLCQKLPGDEFPAEIWQITGTGFNWVRAHSQNFVLVLGMRISFNSTCSVHSCHQCNAN